MKALRFHAAKDARLETVPDPSGELQAKQILVKNKICGICGSDLHEYAAGPIFIPTQPHPYTGASGPQILGHEYGGEVVAVGREITHVNPGDRVSIQPFISPRDDFYGKLGLYQLSEQLAVVGLSWPWGGMAEYSVLNDYNVFRVPDQISDEQSALFEPTAVAIHAVDRSGIGVGSSILIVGAGPIGALSMLAAHAAGATQIFISDTNDNRLALVKQILPACITINPKQGELLNIIRDLTIGNVGVDAALECVGNDFALNDCIAAVRRQGVVVQVGLHMRPASIDCMSITFKEIDLRGSMGYPTTIWPRISSIIASGIFPADKIVTRRIDLTQAVEQGFEALLDPTGQDLKILIDVTE